MNRSSPACCCQQHPQAGVRTDISSPGRDTLCFIPAAGSRRLFPRAPHETNLDVQSSRSGDAGGTSGGLLGSAVSTSSSTYPFKVKTPCCLSLTPETSALTEGREAPSLGGDRAGYRCLQLLGVKVLSEGEQEPRMGIQGCPLG